MPERRSLLEGDTTAREGSSGCSPGPRKRRNAMMTRCLTLLLVALALAALAAPSLFAADKTHEATVVKAGDGKITLTFKGDDQKHTHDVAKDAKITLDDKKAKLEELKEGFPVKVVWDDKFVITKIEAKSKGK